MSLYQYLVRLETILVSRRDIEVQLLKVDVFTLGVKFTSRLRFHDGSSLSIAEELETIDQRSFERRHYKFHYQDKEDNLIFRYDNAPHHPHLSTSPAHKHIRDSIVEAEPPDLSTVLAEIDAIIYPGSNELDE